MTYGAISRTLRVVLRPSLGTKDQAGRGARGGLVRPAGVGSCKWGAKGVKLRGEGSGGAGGRGLWILHPWPEGSTPSRSTSSKSSTARGRRAFHAVTRPPLQQVSRRHNPAPHPLVTGRSCCRLPTQGALPVHLEKDATGSGRRRTRRSGPLLGYARNRQRTRPARCRHSG